MTVRRWLCVGWAVLCLTVAFNAAAGMFVTFAPRQGQSAEAAAAEIAGLERGRIFWSGPVWRASGLLATSGVLVAALGWRRGTSAG